ncbi:uroporphyrinogen-III C-methyltransferase [uncultured Xylophilus sp.]|uniref:uroporphyrinogen-III C-methyltransferase n=1 Tax=uncultured Xylophilus sp. TaxID=296832 RepID=UPI0025CD7800|nr:uroporphyrinogen-III C-methyltransferase [uncultured Xylophilus sp.]
MSSPASEAGLPVAAATPSASLPPTAHPGVPRPVFYGVAVLSVVALVAAVLLWQRLSSIQEQLARQSADSGAQAIEARTMARQAQDTAQDTATRVGVVESRLGEVALQRSQLEELMQSLSRSRDETLVVDIESSLRLAQQQSELTGSVEPLLAAMRTADQRIERAAQPRLVPVQRALARDIDRVRSAGTTDTPGLLARLDELVRLVDSLPLLNAVAQAGGMAARPTATAAANTDVPGDAAALPWWRTALQRGWAAVRDELRGLVRVSRIDRPEAALLAPDQSFFLRENLKLKLVNARLGVLARQPEAARADLAAASAALGRYFDPAARRVQTATSLLQQAQAQIGGSALPRLDDTFAALATAAAGR